jgi:fatty acid desaturase
MTEPTRCNRCQGELTHRSRPQLLWVGIALCLLPLAAIRIPLLWLPAIFMIFAGTYLVYWATAGKGLWCRQCKAIPQ